MDVELRPAVPKVPIAGVQVDDVAPLPCSHPTVAGSSRAVSPTVPLTDVHFECPRRALAQKEGANFIVIITPKEGETKPAFRDPSHPHGTDV